MTRDGFSTIGRDLRDGPPRQRRQRAALWGPVLASHLSALRSRQEQVVADYRAALELRTGLEANASDLPHVDAEDRRKALWIRVGGFSVLAIETVLAVGISVWSLTLWPIVSGAIGALVALGWTAGSLGVHYGASETSRPEQARQSARRGAWVSFVIGMLGLIPLLLARSLPHLAVLTGLATAVVSLGFSSLAAYLFLLAFLTLWAGPHAQEYEQILAEIALAEQLAQEAKGVAEGTYPLRPVNPTTASSMEVIREATR